MALRDAEFRGCDTSRIMAAPEDQPTRVPMSSLTTQNDLSGTTLGDYRLLRRLGEGGMAEVYLAEQGSLRRKVALKLLKRHLAQDATFIRRFQLEAQAAAALVDAHIVQIYEVGCEAGQHYIAQEYVAGENLAQLLKRQGPCSFGRGMAIARQVTAALVKAADRKIVHRDIKPENIMISTTGEVKVADFGLARGISEQQTQLTQAGVTLGTPLYMSPEQVEGRELDCRSDLYSFGVTCYHLFAGEPPFRGDTALAVAVQHLKKEPARLEALRPDLPPGLCRVVHRMLAKDPAARYASPRDLWRELRQLAPPGETIDETWGAQLDLGSQEADTARTVALANLSQAMRRAPAVPSTGAQGWAWAAAAAAAMVIGGIAGWLLMPPDPLAFEAPPIARSETVYAQWVAALNAPSEAAWKSIEEYFPHEEYFVLRARQQLARLYLTDGRLGEARQLFDDFSPSAEPAFRAFGLGGRAIVESLQNQHQQSQQTLAELAPLRRELPADLGRILTRAAAASRAALAQAEQSELERWLDEQFGDEAGGEGEPHDAETTQNPNIDAG